jgi:hypothetical protein
MSLLPLERLGLVVHGLPHASKSCMAWQKGGPRDSSRFTGIGVKYFNFNKPPGEGAAGHIAIIWVLETDGTRTGDMRTSCTWAREPSGHRLQLSSLLFPGPEGGEKTRLGGEVHREEQLLPRAGTSKDRDGTDEEPSEGVFHMPFPLAPARPESQGTRGQARSPRPAHAD